MNQWLFLDVSAAFDKVWHNGLLAKLGQVGVEGSFLDILRSYLSNRKQTVVVDGVKSGLAKLLCWLHALRSDQNLVYIKSHQLNVNNDCAVKIVCDWPLKSDIPDQG